MYAEDDLLPISGLQHLHFCPRQCALIHVEGQWAENYYTAAGKVEHERVHAGGGRTDPKVRKAFALQLRSLALGLYGIADVVEFHRENPKAPWRPFPVEHKRGRPKRDACDAVQLCAQGMCLEEMLGLDVPGGALFYGSTRRRLDVAFDAPLRQKTMEQAKSFHELVRSGHTPRATYSPDTCDRCSLLDLCMPTCAGKGLDVASYMKKAFFTPNDKDLDEP